MINLGGFGFNTSKRGSTKALLCILSISKFSDKLHPTLPLSHLLPLSYRKISSIRFNFIIGTHRGNHIICHSHFCSCGGKKKELWNVQPRF